MIHVCYTIFDRDGHYSKFIGTSILSMFENTREKIMVHLIHDSTLTRDNRNKFAEIISRYDQQIKFYNVDELVPNRLDEIRNRISADKFFRWSIAMFYRFFAPNLIDAKKIIYLDADTIVNLDMVILWQLDLENRPIAGMPESLMFPIESVKKSTIPLCRENIIDWREYFNSGVLIMDLDAIRKFGDLLENSLNVLEKFSDVFSLPDQDALNLLFKDNYLPLPAIFNVFVRELRLLNQPQIIDSVIYHYTDLAIEMNTSDVFNRLWFEYFIKTPFFSIETFENLQQGAEKRCLQENFLWHKLMISTATKHRVFLNYSRDTKSTIEYFGTNARDEIFEINGTDFEDDIVELVKNSSPEKFFIICVEDEIYDRIRKKLVELNFVEYENFCCPNFCFKNPLVDGFELVQSM